MVIINPGSIAIGDQVRQKLGRTCEYGRRVYGGFFYGEVMDEYGEYQMRKGKKKQNMIKREFNMPYNPRTVLQQANRQKYADSVVEWQALTNVQKAVYNIRAVGRKMSGYNLFQKEYLLSH